MVFNSYKFFAEEGHIKISAERTIQFENKDSDYIQYGTPKWWDDYILNNINISEYQIYFICSCTVPHGLYNRLTDYKKIWGLSNLKTGLYNDSYINDFGKVYFGIIKAQGENEFQSDTSRTILLIKKGVEIVCEDIFDVFCKSRFDFINMNNSETKILKNLSIMYKDSILFRFNSIDEIKLDIYGENVTSTFSEIDILKHENVEEAVIYRKP